MRSQGRRNQYLLQDSRPVQGSLNPPLNSPVALGGEKLQGASNQRRKKIRNLQLVIYFECHLNLYVRLRIH